MLLINRYISQVRQEIAVRLHARLYPGGEGPSKVRRISIYIYLETCH